MTSIALLFTLAAIGIAETAYLIRKRIEAEKPICPIGGGCAQVLNSQYNRIFGIHNDVLGMLFYCAVAVWTGLLVVGAEPLFAWNLLIAVAIGGALVMSAYFVYLQWRVIHAWCFWCLMSASTILLMATILAIHGLVLITSV